MARPRSKAIVVVAAAAAVVLFFYLWSPGSGPGPSPAAAAVTIKAVKVVGGLNFPAAFTFGPGGTIWYGERLTGKIRIYDPGTKANTLFFTIPNVVNKGEQGLLGLALSPNFPSSPYVYAYAVRNVSGTLRDQIVRITDSGGKGGAMKVIFTVNTVAGLYHDGGRILFGPDGMLYAVVGEGHNSARSQNLKLSAGKILRMTPTGGVPSGNPFPKKRIWAYGVRNSYGFAFDPQTGHLWETENGPECNDELNRMIKGRNFGWGPSETCLTPPAAPMNTNQDGPSPVLPLRWYTPTIAPKGAAFCHSCGLGPASEGAFFFGAYNTGEIRRVTLSPDRLTIASQAVVYTHGQGVLSMERAPSGTIYFSDAGAIFRLASA